MAWVAPVAGAAAGIIGDLISQSGSQQTNAAQIALAQQQMQFQKDMATHAVQYRMQDIQQAGLNPLLAVTGGGAPAAQAMPGSMAQLQNPSAAFGSLGAQAGPLAGAAVQAATVDSQNMANYSSGAASRSASTLNNARAIQSAAEAAETQVRAMKEAGETVAPGTTQRLLEQNIRTSQAQETAATAAGNASNASAFFYGPNGPAAQKAIADAKAAGAASDASEAQANLATVQSSLVDMDVEVRAQAVKVAEQQYKQEVELQAAKITDANARAQFISSRAGWWSMFFGGVVNPAASSAASIAAAAKATRAPPSTISTTTRIPGGQQTVNEPLQQ